MRIFLPLAWLILGLVLTCGVIAVVTVLIIPFTALIEEAGEEDEIEGPHDYGC
jgi:hypothetical protein